MKKVTVTGKSIEDAVKEGLAQLNAVEDQVEITIIEQPSKGLFGLIGTKEAKVELQLKHDAIQVATTFLDEIFGLMNVDITIEKLEEEDNVRLNFIGSELGILIGRRGQTLDSLQYLVNIVANRNSDSHTRIILDAEDFRVRRKKTLQQLALRLANRVSKTGREVVLEPMSPLERKIIHSFLQEHPKVQTYSKGEEPNRRVVILLR